jgi:hypothetical protein
MTADKMNEQTSTVSAVELDVDCDRYPEIARVLAYWRKQRGERELPARADIDPLDFAPYLSRVMMAEVSYDPLVFRYRVAGTGIFAMHGEELTRKLAHELTPPAYGALIQQHYTEAVARRAPILHVVHLNIDSVAASYARIILPLSSDARTIDRLLLVECYEDHLDDLQRFFEKA